MSKDKQNDPQKARLKLGSTVKIKYEDSVFLGVLAKVTPSVIYLAKTHEVLRNSKFPISNGEEMIAFARNAIEFIGVYNKGEKGDLFEE